MLAHGPDRVSLSAKGMPDLARPLWVATLDDTGNPIKFVAAAGPVVGSGVVAAVGESSGQSRIYSFAAETGEPLWSAPIPPPFVDSWSSPAIDEANRCVVFAAGAVLSAFDLVAGNLLWETALDREVVNAAPLVTSGLGPVDRIFITDFDGFGFSAQLYCINVDPFDPAENPYQPGEVVWSVPIGGSSGNSPAYLDGVVYVATTGNIGTGGKGQILAFDATRDNASDPIWTFTNTQTAGFFGGVCVTEMEDGLAVFAASYSFFGSLFNSNLVKLDALTGLLVWSTSSVRTSSIPVPLGDGRVALAAGVAGFGAVPTLLLYEDEGDHATLLWDSATATWEDADNDGVLDIGEFMVFGGWSNQPAGLVGVEEGGVLLVGALDPATTDTAVYPDLYTIDVSVAPTDASFVLSHAAGAGASPAVADGLIFTLGPGGLMAFASFCPADCNADSAINVFDFLCFQGLVTTGDTRADCNADDSINIFDFLCFQGKVSLGCP